MIAGSSKKVYSIPTTFTKTSQHKANVISDADGNLLSELAAVLNRRTEYCSVSSVISIRYTFSYLMCF
ncbi:hypothetical protein DPMN_004498 [Dreissena polymorpha]|uniref:Uncharacterized protein n=1 Tax=Dreissena polymorpha TaxID=45954 RepID=A0A9D4MQF6_DREPO|nr:hypothetical protein DPMN_004498 [Dreissena polymorpha]